MSAIEATARGSGPILRALAAVLLLAAPLGAQVTPDSVRVEAVRSRAFIRAAETQLSKVLALLDSLLAQAGEVPEPEPEPLPEAPQGAAPTFGDDPADRLIRRDDFERYTGDVSLFGTYGTEDKSLMTDGGHTGAKYLRQSVGPGTEGRQVVFARPSSEPTHYFVDYWFRLDTRDPGAMKWLIVHHDSEPVTMRYQFDASQVVYGDGPGWDHPGTSAPEEARFGSRWEARVEVDGPVAIARADTWPVFVWDNGGPVPHKEAAPVWTSDEDIALTPWGALDDGRWHRHTVELRVGDGLAGYVRGWIDGFPYLDSSSGPMSYVGRPEGATYWESEAAPDGHTAFRIDFDDITVWER